MCGTADTVSTAYTDRQYCRASHTPPNHQEIVEARSLFGVFLHPHSLHHIHRPQHVPVTFPTPPSYPSHCNMKVKLLLPLLYALSAYGYAKSHVHSPHNRKTANRRTLDLTQHEHAKRAPAQPIRGVNLGGWRELICVFTRC